MNKKILIIDDDVSIADFLQIILKSESFDVAIAHNGKDGLELAAEYRPDLVILDIMMPKMHGYQVCQKLRADERHKGIKVLMTSSKAYAADQAQAKETGADAYLAKPYEYKELLVVVRRLLGLTGADGKPAPPRPPAPQEPARVTRTTPVPQKAVETNPALKLDIRVRFWGTRGSSPAPGPQTVRYGGNTSCIELRIGGMLFIIDSGTGIRELGGSLMEEFKDKPIVGHVFVGHTHWDHIQGFPFFTPLYIPRNQFTVHSVRAAGKSLEKVFRGQMAADYFPVPLQSLASALTFVELDGPIMVGPVKVSYHFLNHPGVAIGFRFDVGKKSVTYLSDHEPFGRLYPPSDVTRRQDEGIVEFARNSDLLICEAQYTEEEYLVKRGWGHSTFNDAVDRAVQSGSKRLAIFHHDPAHTDEMMDRYISQCQARVREAGSNMACFGAQEGQIVSL